MRAKLGLIALAACIAAATSASAEAANPTASGAATPSTVAPGRSTLLTVAVSPGTAPASTGLMVTCNLSSILSGLFNQLLVDDGSNGDVHAGDLVFSYRASLSPTTPPGPRSLSCVVSDSQGRVAVTQIALNVDAAANQPPSVNGGGPYSANEGALVPLAAAGSDPENDPLTYAWDLDHDGVFETPGQTATLFVDDGPAGRQVRVRASDGLLSAVDEVSVDVANVAPTASLHVPESARPGSSFTVSLDASADASAADSAGGFDYAFDCGSGYGAYSSAATATCTAGTGSSVAVGGRIRDKDGGVTEYQREVALELTTDGLCQLTRSLSRKPKVADRLCRRLDKAARARSAKQRRKQLRVYRFQVRAQTGAKRRKAFTPESGALLQRLAVSLERG